MIKVQDPLLPVCCSHTPQQRCIYIDSVALLTIFCYSLAQRYTILTWINTRITLSSFAASIWLWEIPEHETGECMYCGPAIEWPIFWIQRLVHLVFRLTR